MPLHYIRSTQTYKLIIWKATEDLSFFYETCGLDGPQIEVIKQYKDHRQLELCSTQFALNALMGEVVTFSKDTYGRPIIDKYPNLNLSLSHTDLYTAALVTPLRSGLDIQIERDKITRIVQKFLFDEEIEQAQSNSIQQFHFYWGVKESVFKAWGRGNVAFREMINVVPFQVKRNSIMTAATFDNGDAVLRFDVFGKKLDDLYLSLVLESKES